MNNQSYFWQKKNLLSFIVVIFVVFIHNSAINQYQINSDFFTQTTHFVHNLFAYGIGGVAVPLFFFFAGLVFFRNYKTKLFFKKLKSRTKTLLIPYLIWNIVGLLFAIIYTFTPIKNYISGRDFFSPTLNNILEGIFLYKYNFQFWFIYDLIIYVIFTPIIYLLIKNKYIGGISCMLILILPLFINSFLSVNTSFMIFYFLGGYCGKHFFKKLSQPSTKKISIIFTIMAIITIIIRMLSIYNIFSIQPIINQITLIILLFSIYYSSDLFMPKNNLKFTSQFFPIYVLHTYVLSITVKLIFLINKTNSSLLLFNELFSTFFTIFIITIIASIWQKKLPKTYKLVFGNSRS